MRNATYLDFPLDEYEGRHDRLRTSMTDAGLDAVLLTTRDNVEFLSGFSTPSWRLGEKRFWLLVASAAPPVLFVDQVHEVNAIEMTPVEDIRVWGVDGVANIDLLVDALRGLGLGRARIGLELGAASSIRMTPGELEDLRDGVPEVTFVDCDEVVGRSRMVKSPLEVERIRKAVEITEAGLLAGFRAARAGRTERELVSAIAAEWLRQGAETPYSGNNYGYLAVQAGRVLQMTPSPVDRKIETGDLIQVDCGASYRGYAADIYRNAVVGTEPTPTMQRYAEGTRFVVDSVIEAIKPGVTSAELCAAGEQAISEAGLAQYRRPLSNAVGNEKGPYVGHGIGYSLHEYPTIQPEDHTPWLPGMCGAIEVSLGDDETGYLEWEDDFLVTEAGSETLSKTEKAIFVTA